MVQPLPPFMGFVNKTIPTAFENSMSYYDTLCVLYNYIQNDLLPATNESIALTQQLKEYVEHYFDNLDIQEEVNNKLDEMAESGELSEIIAQYVNLHSVLAFDNIASMKNGNNMIEGSVCRTCGNTTYNDGDGGLYRIRTITTQDVIDDYYIVSLNFSNTLIAERIVNVTDKVLWYDTLTEMKQDEHLKENYIAVTFGNTTFNDGDSAFYKIRTITPQDVVDEYYIVSLTFSNDLVAERVNNRLNEILGYDTVSDMKSDSTLKSGDYTRTYGNETFNDGDGAFYKIRPLTPQDVVDEYNIVSLNFSETLIAERIIKEVTTQKKMIVIGDSYSNEAQSGTPLWYEYIAQWDGLDVYTNANDGQGFATGNNTFLTQLQTAKANVPIEEIDRIYIVGGLNDIGNLSLNITQFNSAVTATLDYARDNFPNVKVYVIGIMPFQFYNTYSGTTPLDAFRASTFNGYLAYNCTSYANVIFKSSEFFGLNIPDFYGTPNSGGQRHPSSKGEKAIANFIYNGNATYGFKEAEAVNCPFMSTTITCSNGSAKIHCVNQDGYDIDVSNYNSASALNISLANLPCFSSTYAVVTDERGHTNFLYVLNNNLHLDAQTGLQSGNLYIKMNFNFDR